MSERERESDREERAREIEIERAIDRKAREEIVAVVFIWVPYIAG